MHFTHNSHGCSDPSMLSTAWARSQEGGNVVLERSKPTGHATLTGVGSRKASAHQVCVGKLCSFMKMWVIRNESNSEKRAFVSFPELPSLFHVARPFLFISKVKSELNQTCQQHVQAWKQKSWPLLSLQTCSSTGIGLTSSRFEQEDPQSFCWTQVFLGKDYLEIQSMLKGVTEKALRISEFHRGFKVPEVKKGQLYVQDRFCKKWWPLMSITLR